MGNATAHRLRGEGHRLRPARQGRHAHHSVSPGPRCCGLSFAVRDQRSSPVRPQPNPTSRWGVGPERVAPGGERCAIAFQSALPPPHKRDWRRDATELRVSMALGMDEDI